MKRVFTCAGGLLLSFVLISTCYAGAIDNKTNWSAEYIRTLNRNAATDYADIAAYNPAGTVKLHEGLTINGSVQYLNKEYKNIIDGTSYKSEEPSYVPGLFAVYNKERWALFGSVTVVGGGGKVDFSDGDWRTMQAYGYVVNYGGYAPNTANPPSMDLSGESFYVGYTAGTAFKLNDMFSFSMGLRYVNAHKEAEGSINYSSATLPAPIEIKYEQDGDGWGGIFGLDFTPNDKLNIGMRYETETDINLENKVKKDTTESFPNFAPPWNQPPYPPLLIAQGIIDDTLTPRSLPATLAIGASYWLTPQLRIEADCTYYFNKSAGWGGEEDNVDDGYDLGIALEYHFNESLLASIGYLHTVLGVDPEYMLPENPELDANTVGAGIAYAFNENFHTNISIGNTFYVDDSYTAPPKVKYEKNVFFLAMGFEYRF